MLRLQNTLDKTSSILYFHVFFLNFLHLEITGLLDEFSLKLLRYTLYLQVGFRRYRKQPELDVVTCCDFHLRT